MLPQANLQSVFSTKKIGLFYRQYNIKTQLDEMKFAKYIFLLAGVSGIIILLPLYFAGTSGITRLEFYYGFIGIALAFQILFIIISRDPVRFRTAMIPCILEKFGFAIPAFILYSQNRIETTMFYGGIMDFVLGILFITAYLKTPEEKI